VYVFFVGFCVLQNDMAMVQSVVVMMAATPSILPRAELPSLSRLSPAPLLRSLGLGRQWDSVKVGPLTVSPMGIGTWAWGNQLLWGYEEEMDEELQRVFNFAISKGINFFDTADSYGTGKLNGRSELLLGKFIQEYRGGKEGLEKNVNIATKFAAYPWRLMPSQIVSACNGSLDRLEMDQLALGQLHWSTVNYAPFQEQALWDGLIAVYEQGLVKAIGVSNYGPKQLVRIHKYLQRRGVPLSSVQVQFSLLSKGIQQMEVKAVCDDLGIKLIAYSPLGLGMLTGKYSPTNVPQGPRGFLFKQVLPGLDPLLNTMRDIAEKRGKTISQVAINWCICKGAIPIPGVKSLQQAQDNIGALSWQLNGDEVARLEFVAEKAPRGMIQNIFQTA
jgi:pyridoxine 4-dehydrogenase